VLLCGFLAGWPSHPRMGYDSPFTLSYPDTGESVCRVGPPSFHLDPPSFVSLAKNLDPRPYAFYFLLLVIMESF
jgi:hypothetical protein